MERNSVEKTEIQVRLLAIVSSLMGLALLGVPLVATAQDEGRGVTSPPFYIDAAARFAIIFPVEPNLENIDYATEDGSRFPAKHYSVVEGSNHYRLTYVDFSTGPAADARIVEHAVNDWIGQGELIYQSDAEYEPGVESRQLMVSRGDGNEIQASAYMWDHRLILTEAIGPPGTPSLLRFAQSLTLLTPDGGVM